MDVNAELAEAVALLKQLKRDLMQQRQFGSDTLGAYRNACVSVEGDVEEWLKKNGYMNGRT